VNKFKNVFETYDAILSPVTANVAPKVGESLEKPLRMYISDVYTTAVNIAGLPAIAFPVGKSKEGMPIGLQLIGNHFCEKEIIDIACICEQNM